ncbi:MAG: hypothetical protein QM619_12130 [Micropruina sp.]|uniref:hypothetical protein n=1 Tax=Micropruina sp. TaxID=2737536 RepID=UPI0039E3BBE3
MTQMIAALGLSPLELLAVLSGVVLAVSRWLPSAFRRQVAVAALAVAMVSVAVAATVAFRWQLLLVAAGIAVALTVALPSVLGRTAAPAGRRWPAVLAGALSLGLLTAGAVAGSALPISDRLRRRRRWRPGSPATSAPPPYFSTDRPTPGRPPLWMPQSPLAGRSRS